MPRNQILAQVESDGIERKPVGWIPISEIGKGDNSTVFKVTDSNGKIEAAMKVEKVTKGGNAAKNIEREVLLALRDDPQALQVLDYCHAGLYRCTVMTMAGPDLQFIKTLMNNRFSDSTILRLSIRVLLAIKSLHEHCYLHRDLEPGNIALSFDSGFRNIVLLDFGTARLYAKCENGKWSLRAPREKVPFRGSLQYCSARMHDGEEVGRVDDLWSWLYVFLEMRICLPWTDSTHQMKYAPRKRNLLNEIFESDAFLASYEPIVKILKKYKYADRPDYFKIYEILAAKMEQIGAKWTDPMDYEAQLEMRFRYPKFTADEKTIQEQITTAFQTVVVPGGAQYLTPPNVDFLQKEKKGDTKMSAEKERKEAAHEKAALTSDAASKISEAPSKAETPSKQPLKATRTPKNNNNNNKKNTKTRSTTSSASRATDSPTDSIVPATLPVVATRNLNIKKKNMPLATNKVKCK